MTNPANHPKSNIFSQDQLIEAYKTMVLIRKFEEQCAKLYGEGAIAGFCHLYIGQEAVATGVQSALKQGDSIITGYRDHGHNLTVGTDPYPIMAELLGRSSGISGGKGGSMHLFDPERGFFGGHGIVGAQVSLGTGIAFANKYLKNENVSVVFFGDGAANQGQVYESFNMAKLWHLPALYIIENNQYAMGTAVGRAAANPENLHLRGAGHGIDGEKVDGMNLFAIKEATTKALEKVRQGHPVLLEMNTYRYRGHSMSDPAKYRTKEEVNDYKENHDPITLVRNYILDNNLCMLEKLEEIEEKIEDDMAKMTSLAQLDSEPNLHELMTNIYSDH